MLHAQILEFKHPTTNKMVKFEAPLPEYFEKVLEEKLNNNQLETAQDELFWIKNNLRTHIFNNIFIHCFSKPILLNNTDKIKKIKILRQF